MLPILAGTVIPMLIISAIVFVLRPKGGATVEDLYDHPTSVIISKPNRGHIYFSSTWNAKPERFKYQTQEDPADLHPIFDEIETFISASEARMVAEIDAAYKARKILFELGQERRKQLQLV